MIIKKSFWNWIFLLICTKLNAGYGERTKDKMYVRINGVAACFRRMNATHQTGCTSDQDGSTGVIHLVETLPDLELILAEGTGGPYVPVMQVKLFTVNVANTIKTSRKISGLMLYRDNKTELEHYTHEDSCPNRYYGLEDTCRIQWNKPGTGLLNYDFPFPIFYVNNYEDFLTIKECFAKFNNYSFTTQNERALCSLELTSFMFATTDTPTCIRRSSPRFNLNSVKLCDPMGDENVWASLFPVGNSTVQFGNVTLNQKVRGDMKYIIVAARLDSNSMFHEIVPGAINPITGIVALLSTAHLLKQMLPVYDNYATNVLFVFLNGESYDYIGSQRLLYDMEQLSFPTMKYSSSNEVIPMISPENVTLFVELSQLFANGKDVMQVHVRKNSEVRNFLTKLSKYGRKTMQVVENQGELPPTSLQTFLKFYPDLPGVIIAGHGEEYENKFYNSIYDSADNLNFIYYHENQTIPPASIQQYIANVSAVVAQSLYEEITHTEAPNSNLNITLLVNELLNCYLLDANCSVHRAIQKKKLISEPFSMYVGVSSVTVSTNLITKLIGLTLAWLTADIVNATGPCPPNVNSYVNKYFNMSKGLSDLNVTICYRTCMNFTEAVSPAFKIEGYDWKSNKYSSWTESIWKEFDARIFLKPSRSHENMSIAVGSMIMVLSFVLVYFIKSRAHILFPLPAAMPPTRC